MQNPTHQNIQKTINKNKHNNKTPDPHHKKWTKNKQKCNEKKKKKLQITVWTPPQNPLFLSKFLRWIFINIHQDSQTYNLILVFIILTTFPPLYFSVFFSCLSSSLTIQELRPELFLQSSKINSSHSLQYIYKFSLIVTPS